MNYYFHIFYYLDTTYDDDGMRSTLWVYECRARKSTSFFISFFSLLWEPKKFKILMEFMRQKIFKNFN